jgi:hypothetical protein
MRAAEGALLAFDKDARSRGTEMNQKEERCPAQKCGLNSVDKRSELKSLLSGASPLPPLAAARVDRLHLAPEARGRRVRAIRSSSSRTALFYRSNRSPQAMIHPLPEKEFRRQRRGDIITNERTPILRRDRIFAVCFG